MQAPCCRDSNNQRLRDAALLHCVEAVVLIVSMVVARWACPIHTRSRWENRWMHRTIAALNVRSTAIACQPPTFSQACRVPSGYAVSGRVTPVVRQPCSVRSVGLGYRRFTPQLKSCIVRPVDGYSGCAKESEAGPVHYPSCAYSPPQRTISLGAGGGYSFCFKPVNMAMRGWFWA